MGKKKIDDLLKQAQDIIEGAKADDRALTDDEHAKAAGLIGEAMKIRDEMKSAARDDELKAQLGELFDGVAETQQKASESPESKGQPREPRTLGEQVVGSAEWQAWFKQHAPDGVIPETRKGINLPPVQIKGGLRLFERKELITGLSPTSAGAFITPEDTGIYEPIGRFPTVLRDLISVRQTGTDAVEFVRQTRQVTEAAPTPEANVKEYSGATGEISGRKPQGQMNFERVQEVVKTIAVWVGVTKRALSDAGQIRGIIDQELREDLVDELEDQLFNGDGMGENFTGIINQPGILQQAFDTDVFTTTRRAITNLMVNGRQLPTAWVFSPLDWETVELTQDNIGRYYHGGPLNLGPYRLWGVPVVQSFHAAAGASWVANWRKAVLWDREQASISATDSHEDWFVRNMVAVLAEMRAAFGLIRPQAFVQTFLS